MLVQKLERWTRLTSSLKDGGLSVAEKERIIKQIEELDREIDRQRAIINAVVK